MIGAAGAPGGIAIEAGSCCGGRGIASSPSFAPVRFSPRSPTVRGTRGLLFALLLVTATPLLAAAPAERASGPGAKPSAAYEAALGLVQSGRPQEGMRRMRALAEGGDPDAQFFVGNLFFFPQYGIQDFEQAFRWYQRAAALGHVEAQHHIGIMYSRGAHVKADQEQAVAWYRKAAEAGSPNAQFDLAYRYHSGRGVAQDLERARSWYAKAAAQGHEGATNNLAHLRRRGAASAEPSGFSSLRDAAAAGDPEAQWQLYRAYDAGLLDTAKDPEKARHWLAEAATNRHPKALRLVVRSGFLQGCQSACLPSRGVATACTDDCQCIIERLEERFEATDLVDRMIAAVQDPTSDFLIELIEVAQGCGGIRL